MDAATHDAATEVARREDSRRAALRAADLPALQALVDDALVYRHAILRMDDKASMLASMAPGRYRSIDVRRQQVSVSGGTAIVDMAETIVTAAAGQTRTHKVAAIDVWTRGADGAWRLLARQANYEEPPS
jgi:ketosteroid isomerase-like protein